MIGIKTKLQDKNGVFEIVSEPYVAVMQNHTRTYIMVLDLHSNEFSEINVNSLHKKVTDQEFARWNNGRWDNRIHTGKNSH